MIAHRRDTGERGGAPHRRQWQTKYRGKPAYATVCGAGASRVFAREYAPRKKSFRGP